jgi:5-methyltetrahydrofolate--homocysteine methyltransferase
MAEPNAGVPRLISGMTVYDEGPDEMEAGIDDLITAGANIIGGCCGTTPEHIQRIARRVQEYQTNVEE